MKVNAGGRQGEIDRRGANCESGSVDLEGIDLKRGSRLAGKRGHGRWLTTKAGAVEGYGELGEVRVGSIADGDGFARDFKQLPQALIEQALERFGVSREGRGLKWEHRKETLLRKAPAGKRPSPNKRACHAVALAKGG